MWLIDTNVLSEFKRRTPSQKVLGWLDRQPLSDLFTSVVVLAELGHGIAFMPDGDQKLDLVEWLDTEIRPLFAGRVFLVDETIVRAALSIQAAGRRGGRTFPATDLFIGATAAVHNLTVVTRNTRDFEGTGTMLLNPWSA
jgi:predicted nucleic acid-binding protein